MFRGFWSMSEVMSKSDQVDEVRGRWEELTDEAMVL